MEEKPRDRLLKECENERVWGNKVDEVIFLIGPTSVDYVYFENSSSNPYLIRRIEELNKTANGNVEAKVVCFYRRRDISNSLIMLADKHAKEVEEESETTNEADLTDKQKHQLKHRELFLSRQYESLPATHISGAIDARRTGTRGGILAPCQEKRRTQQTNISHLVTALLVHVLEAPGDKTPQVHVDQGEQPAGPSVGAVEPAVAASFSLSPDKAIMEPPHPVPQNDAKAHQELLKRVMEELEEGKCSVALLNETESVLSYLDKEDTFFYSLVYDPSLKTLLADKGEIRVGPRYQADVPDMLVEELGVWKAILTSVLLLAAALPSELGSRPAAAALQLPSSEGSAAASSSAEVQERDTLWSFIFFEEQNNKSIQSPSVKASNLPCTSENIQRKKELENIPRELDDREQAKLEVKVWDPDSPLTDRQIDQFLVVARSYLVPSERRVTVLSHPAPDPDSSIDPGANVQEMAPMDVVQVEEEEAALVIPGRGSCRPSAVGTFARALDCSSSVRQPSLHMSAAAASRDITLFHAMDTLHKHNYDLSSAISVLVPLGGPVLCRDEMEEWSASEASLFEEALEKYGKDFNDIRQDFLPWKSLTSIIEYYYMWKTTDRYVQQRSTVHSRLQLLGSPQAAQGLKKRAEVLSKEPSATGRKNSNKPNPNQLSSNSGKPGAVNGAMGASYQAQTSLIGRACESCYDADRHCEIVGSPLKIKSTRKPLSCIIGYLEIHPAMKPNVVRSMPSLQTPAAKRMLATSNHSSRSILGKRNYSHHNGLEGM
ncbi:Metastasis-associated protein MTA3 [Chelonia mydas]|uniref:Metastasis-associated protein MTA3 n=1 Tax=Chelonia mydas TaxID=8469 RepID=M7BGU1_CHEMY|nr:Metastasis-associated protein MTA3 [Chelonia mydas]